MPRILISALIAGMLVIASCARRDREPVATGVEQDINELRQKAEAGKINAAEIQNLGDALLKKYTKDEDQGRIYLELAQLYLRCGSASVSTAEDCCLKSLKCPQVSPLFTVQTYYLLGQCEEQLTTTAGTKEESAQRRQDSITAYLKGLSEIAKNGTPEQAPPVPLDTVYDVHDVGHPQTAGIVAAAQAQSARDRAAAVLMRQLVQLRGLITDRITAMYQGAKPPELQQLRQLAGNEIGDTAAVDRLMNAIAMNNAKQGTVP